MFFNRLFGATGVNGGLSIIFGGLSGVYWGYSGTILELLWLSVLFGGYLGAVTYLEVISAIWV